MKKTLKNTRRILTLSLTVLGLALLVPPAFSRPLVSTQTFLNFSPFAARYQVKINQTAAGMLHDRGLAALARQMAVDYGVMRHDLEAFTPAAIVAPINSNLPDDFPYTAYWDQLIASDTQSVDDVFVSISIDANERMLALYRAYQARGSNPELVQLARRGLAILAAHRRALRAFD